MVRAIVVDALEEDRFQVLETASGDYAASLLATREDISIMFTDVPCPDVE